jgi:shikimate kinase
MASGKSTIGPRLATRLGMAFLDLDECIEHAAGATIPEIFRERGEAAFRSLESEQLELGLNGPPLVLATGGGVVGRVRNRELLRTRASAVVWIDVRFETVRRRLASGEGSERPLLQELGWTGLARLHAERRILYADCAHFRFNGDRLRAPRLARRIAGTLRSASLPQGR